MDASYFVARGLTALQAVEHELLLFAAFWLILGALDDFAVDLCWIWLKLTGRARTGRIGAEAVQAPLRGRAAVLIAAWQEAAVIGHTVRHALNAWSQQDVTLYIGCYCNDPDTIAAVANAAAGDCRVRIVIGDRPGPTTKADCLNQIYAALCRDEERYGRRFRSILLHDAEDMVHRAELAVLDAALDHADFAQLPVRPEPQPASPWVAGHYSDEFAESHAKGLVVRDALGASIPAAGVGCAFSRAIIERIAIARLGEGIGGPFASDCLTEDYELGVLVWRFGGRSRFLRVREEGGGIVATHAYFPARLDDAVRQKSRWIHGIAFQAWDRLGWGRGAADMWMALRDRRGPLTTIVLCAAYGLVIIEGLLGIARLFGAPLPLATPPGLSVLLGLCFAGLAWRCVVRFAFTAAEYGVVEGLNAIARIPVANVISIMAGRRALVAYVRVLMGERVSWEKTQHDDHPATLRLGAASL